ncbi:MAG: zinc-binding alcohol dehydrogenase [Candidatus Latescibacteria bacterium]|jgi:2-desacetyl-2-hydroxyethyl bacteriochlorophyllide A dehydrogenase|nr:zinc-binding alcohol dehydrogenase [Candidatus Latescibacterota bacterium]
MNSTRLISRAIRQIEVEPFDPGPLPDDAILVENEYTAVSIGTEIYNWTHGGEPGSEPTFPRTTGYCSVGRVLAVGRLVEGIQVGDRVSGQGNHASHNILRSGSGYQLVPPDLDPRLAAFMVMAAIALHGVRVAQIELGSSVVVFGLGLVGQICGQFARLSGGTPVVGVDLDEFRLDTAGRHACDITLDPTRIDDLQQVIAEHCPEDGANIVLECTGLPRVFPQVTGLACLGGKVVAVGSPRGTVDMDFLRDVHLREVSILGAHQPKTPDDDHIYYRWTKTRERTLALRLMAAGRLPLSHLITHEFAPRECQAVYTMLADSPKDVLGVLFDWSTAA